MTIKEFCKQFEDVENNEVLKTEFVKNNVNFNSYVPFVQKVAHAKELAKVSIFNKNSKVEIDSTTHVLFLYKSLIDLYTDLVIENKSFYEEYDCLKKSGAFKYLVNEMGNEDITEFIDICDMTLKDMIKNVNSPESFVIENVKVVGNILTNMLRPYMADIVTEMQRMDKDELKVFMDLIIDIAKKYQR